MEQLVIIGAGGFAREIYGYFRAATDVRREAIVFKGYLDVEPESINVFGEGVHLGIESRYVLSAEDRFLLGMADVSKRAAILAEYFTRGWPSVNVIHPSATIDSSAVIGIGNVIGPHCHIGANVRMGNHNVLNFGCSVGHDSQVGDNNVLASGVQIGGYVQMNDDNFYGISAAIIPRIRIGSGNKVQAGTTVTANIGENAFYFHRDINKVAHIFANGTPSVAIDQQ